MKMVCTIGCPHKNDKTYYEDVEYLQQVMCKEDTIMDPGQILEELDVN